MRILCTILYIFNILSITLGHEYLDAGSVLEVNENDDWSLVPQVDGTFRWMSYEESLLEYQSCIIPRGSLLVDFHLFTHKNPNYPELIQLNDTYFLRHSNFNSSHPTRFIIHGWRNRHSSPVNRLIREAYLSVGKFNIFVVDWSSGADTINYVLARYKVDEVGEIVAQYIDFLHRDGKMSFENLILIGHSLGAHVAGFAGKNLKTNKIPVIYGLDPAMPLFYYNKPNERLSYYDARYVETIQTNGGVLGFKNPIGAAAFYPNWGSKQAGCGTDLAGICSHKRAYKFFAELIIENNFVPVRCESFDKFLERKCEISVNQIRMGSPYNYLNANGIYYLPTNADIPFGHG